MSLRDKYLAQKQKLENLCNEHNLSYRLEMNTPKATLTLRPLQGMYEQISMLDAAESGGRISQDAYLQFWENDGDYGMEIFGTFSIGDALTAKFRNLFKKLDVFYCQFFRRETVETGALRKGMMPEIDNEEGSEQAEAPAEDEPGEEDDEGPADATPDDELLEAATQLVRMENTCTTSLLQRRLKLGYSKALHLIDMLEQRGVVGPYRGSEPRDVLPYDLPEDAEAAK